MVQEDRGRVAMSEPFVAATASLDDGDSAVDLLDVYQKLKRGRKTILLVTVACGALLTATGYMLPVMYTSTASFIPPANVGAPNSMASLVAGQLSSIGAGDLLSSIKSPGDLYAGILKSESIASALVKRFDLMNVYKVKKESLAEKALTSATKVTVDAKSTIVTLAVKAKSPQLAHDLAAGYMGALRETNGRLALSQSAQRREFFGEQLLKEKNDLADAEVELKKTEEQSGLIAPSGQTESEIRAIAGIQVEITSREVQLAALRESATEQNPEVIRLKSEVDHLEGQLSRLERGGGNKSSTTIPASKVPEVQLDYVRKEREVKYHEALFDMLSRQYEAARLDELRDAPVLQVLDAPSYPDTKSFPKRSYFMLTGLALGFIGSCIWVLVREPLRMIRTSLAQAEVP